MRLLAVVFACVAAAAAAGIWRLVQVNGGPGLLELYGDSPPLTKLADMLIGFTTVATLVLGLVRNKEGEPLGGAALKFIAWSVASLGALAALQFALTTWRIAIAVHVTNFQVVAPSYAEALIPLVLGCTCAAFGMALSGSGRPATAAVFE